jgi:hypothetical protein
MSVVQKPPESSMRKFAEHVIWPRAASRTSRPITGPTDPLLLENLRHQRLAAYPQASELSRRPEGILGNSAKALREGFLHSFAIGIQL